MRFFAQRTPPLAFAFVIALLLLMPSFLINSQARGSAPSPQTPSVPDTAAPVPASSSPNALSSYRSAGAADPSMPILVSIAIPLRNLDMLNSIVKQSSDPSSSNFRHFLNYSEASQMFLPTEGQYESVLNYLTASGFTVVETALNSMIVVRGTVAQVDQYLGQGVQLYTNGTYSYYETTGTSALSGALSGAYSYGSNSSGLFMRPDITKSGTVGSGVIPDQNVTFTEGGEAAAILRTVYNSTGLIAKGDNGKGYTVGVLDFYGFSLVSNDLAIFDQTYGLPAPPDFAIDAIGPYNPNLGTPLGWDGEIDLDTQVSHAMAPDANIVLYAANGELPLSTAIAAIIQDGRANVVSQSFGIPEWEYYEIGSLSYLFNLVFSDDYYLLGSAMGMTFTSSTGDAGGSGYSVGPEGGLEYPGSSPYVTSLGGTSTYVSTNAGGALTFNQTAWSNVGFVPYFINYGGSGGGVSILEPTPWYQSSLPVPTSFPHGRMVPDLALDSSGTPGIYVVYMGTPVPFGGTSEASPLFAGLLTLIMGADRGSLGLVNPAIYQIAENSKTYQKAFYPVTFGYTIPWVAKFGYNLVTGWGAPNIGELARLYALETPSQTLNVNVAVVNPGKSNFTDFLPGQKINVDASVSTPTGLSVTTGSFTAALQTLGGTTTPLPLTYSAAQKGWVGTITVGNQAGIAYVDVSGTSGASESGQGFSSTFIGYLATYEEPLAPYPWTFLPGLEVAISVTDLFGNNSEFFSAPIAFNSYSILTNKYTEVGTSILNYSDISGYYIGNLESNALPNGPMTITTGGPVVGYLPFVNGISLLGTYIYPQVVAEPGSVAPGQSMTIVAAVTAPENIYLVTSSATGDTLGDTIAEGSNVTATLISPSGAKVATVSLPESTCAQALRACGAAVTNINGYLTVPANATSGLYTIMLNAAYNDETTGYDYGGSYFGQIYVAPGASVPAISVGPSVLFEGQNATITASITYPNGNEVTHGLYTALIYPETSQYQYSLIDHSTYEAFGLIPLTYDAGIDMWTANVTMPSPYNSALVASTNGNAEYYGGPYDVYVSGVSADGVPTASSLSAQQPFFVQPYVYTANAVMTSMQQTSRLALSNVTISAGSSPLILSNDYFVGNNTVTGSAVTISSSTINGTLNVGKGQTTLNGVTGGKVVATDSNIVLQHTVLSSLVIGAGSTASIDSASSSQAITPALPVLTITSPVANQSYTGILDAQVAIRGTNVSVLSFFVDGKQLPSLLEGNAPGREVTYPLNTTSMPDGTHTLTVVAVQSDLLSSSASVSFVTGNQLTAVSSDLSTASMTISTLSGSLSTADGNIATLQTNLTSANHTITNLTYLSYFAIGLAVVGIALAGYALRGRNAPWKY